MKLGAFDKALTKQQVIDLRLLQITIPTYWMAYPKLEGQVKPVLTAWKSFA